MGFTTLFSNSDSLFLKKYKSIGVAFNLVVPKNKSFSYYYAVKNLNNTYDVFYNTTVSQSLGFGGGIDYTLYWRIKKFFASAIYISSYNGVNLYYQKFIKSGEEKTFNQEYFYSRISETNYNVVFDPSVLISYQTQVSKNAKLNYELGAGFNYHIFYSVNKFSEDLASGYINSSKNTSFPFQLYLKVPLRIEYVTKYNSAIYGLAIGTQFNDSYSLLNKSLHKNKELNSVGNKHQFGLNSPTFLYYKYAGNNYPINSFALNINLSIKF